ncbi:MAG: branched-chain amino acid ABC transporter permease [Planctomycetes bacterium]|nr:branched-chain amino acid ABC transporter permease [Planctomycetota bacterium]
MNLFLAQFIEEYVVQVINMVGVSIILAVSLNVINGLTGQFSLGHAGFMAIGAYVSAFFTTDLSYFNPDTAEYVTDPALVSSVWGYLGALIAGGVAAAVAGVLVGIPTLRLKGDYLAIATLGFGEIVRILITNFEKVGGANGLSGVPQFQIVLSGEGKDALALDGTFFIFSFVIICVLLSAQLQRSTFGRALIAVRENELAAEVMGIPTVRMKIFAFVYGAFFAGIAGGLFAHLLQTVTPASFTFMKSVEVVVMLVLGGLGSMTGAIVGAIVLTVLPEALRDVEQEADLPGIRMVVYSLVLILLMIFRPQGIFGQRELSLRLLRRLVPGRRISGDETPKPSEDRKGTEL